MEKICEFCRSPFTTRRTEQRFCSKSCGLRHTHAQKPDKRVEMTCPVCGTVKRQLPSQYKGFCSRACVTAYQTGKRRPDFADIPRWVVLPNGCWKWQRTDRYGRIRTESGEQQAHRWLYEQYKGPIPEGHHLHHTCLHKWCVNPDHVEPKTPADHIRIHHKTKLTWDEVREIRASRHMRTGYLAEKYGVLPATICDIFANRTWVE